VLWRVTSSMYQCMPAFVLHVEPPRPSPNSDGARASVARPATDLVRLRPKGTNRPSEARDTFQPRPHARVNLRPRRSSSSVSWIDDEALTPDTFELEGRHANTVRPQQR
jgi:hypothetical protein